MRAAERARSGEARRGVELRRRVDLGRREAPHVTILERLPVEGEDLLPLLLVEAGLRLVAQAAGPHELMHERDEREVLACRLREPCRDVDEHVDAAQVAGAEGRRL